MFCFCFGGFAHCWVPCLADIAIVVVDLTL